ncbi:MAG: hypothetical protein VB093_19145 [Propionicimonas sp.]|nr:hypothetical protein [Propionicimonas sp.]
MSMSWPGGRTCSAGYGHHQKIGQISQIDAGAGWVERGGVGTGSAALAVLVDPRRVTVTAAATTQNRFSILVMSAR